jgi:hypothetical protein
MRRSVAAAALIAFSLSAFGADLVSAAPCKDAKGKFIKCPAAAPAKPVKCKDAKGKFAKCSAPGAKPIA